MSASKLQEDRVTSIQSRINEVRSRLQSLNSNTSTLAEVELPSRLSALPRTSETVPTSNVVGRSEPDSQYFFSTPATSSSMLQPPRDVSGQQQMHRIDEQERQIAFLQSQIEQLRMEKATETTRLVEKLRSSSPSITTTREGRFVQQPETTAMILQPDVQVQLSPGVGVSRVAAPHTSIEERGLPPDFSGRSFAEMQAMLRERIAHQSSSVESNPSMNPPFAQNEPAARLYTTPRAARYVDSSESSAAAFAPAATNTNNTLLSQRIPLREAEGTPRVSEVSKQQKMLNENSASDSAPQNAPLPRGSSKSLDPPGQPPENQPSVAAQVSGPEVFALLRLRGVISSEGVTGEHLLPSTHCHSMLVTQNEYVQLMQLRQLLASAALRSSSDATRGASQSPVRSGGSSARVVRPSVAAADAFEKHRQRLNAVRQARAKSPSALK